MRSRHFITFSLACIYLLFSSCNSQDDSQPTQGLFLNPQFEASEINEIEDIFYANVSNRNGLQYSSPLTIERDTQNTIVSPSFSVYYPPNPDEVLTPALMLIHGGDYFTGSKEDLRDLAIEYARLGYVVCSADYRLTPQSYLDNPNNDIGLVKEDANSDIRRAIIHLEGLFGTIRHIDKTRVSAIGISTGGEIALAVGLFQTPSSLRSVVSTGGLLSRSIDFPVNFTFRDPAVLLFFNENQDPKTGLSYDADVQPFVDQLDNSNILVKTVKQPSDTHTVDLMPNTIYGQEVVDFLFQTLALKEL